VKERAVDDVEANFICRPYRGVSVQDTDVPLHPEALRDHLVGRPVYRRTEFLVLRRGVDHAVVQVDKASTEPLFSPVTAVRMLAGPDEVTWLTDEAVDTGNATQMAAAAQTSGRAARVYIVEGRFQHVNFIVEPQPMTIRVVEVVPPEPPKLLEMARAVVDFDEDLPPVILTLDAIDLRDLAARSDATRLLFPCRSGGLDLDRPVDFLDSCPPHALPWTMVGCERSRQIHEAFYGTDPHARIDLCPKQVADGGPLPTLMKCCLLERGTEETDRRVVVPWGANLDEVRIALRRLTATPTLAQVAS
jgi:hypothetical protein